jgi:hypothetical protein
VKRAPLVLLLAFLLPTLAGSEAGPLSWLNRLRSDAGAPPLGSDDALSRTAREWAGVLARAGVLGHRGSDGSTALDRYRALGGTEVRVGEILGAGPRLRDVEEGWMRSDEHRSLVLAPRWTHAGWGSGSARGKEVWVILFCQKLVEGLQIAQGEDVLSISGRFAAADAADAVLLAGLDRVAPRSWDPLSRSFLFLVPGPPRAGYFRLGYESADGAFRLTNAFTLPPGKESPGDSSRFSPPAPSP